MGAGEGREEAPSNTGIFDAKAPVYITAKHNAHTNRIKFRQKQPKDQLCLRDDNMPEKRKKPRAV